METIIGNSILLNMLIGKKWRVVRHICLVSFFAILFYPMFDVGMIEKLNVKNVQEVLNGLRITSLITFFITLFFIYLSIYYATPKFLMKNKIVPYVIICIGSIFIIFLSDIFLSRHFFKSVADIAPLPSFTLKGFVESSLIPIVFLAACAGYLVFKKWIVDSAQLAELKQNKVEQELINLKNQINPHFLFNTLNNLNTLIAVDAKKASAVVLGLSDVLRYQLYEANEEKVLLKKDIEILQQYLELEKIRRDNFQFNITTNLEVFSTTVPPFIFINFVENAIKHSLDNTGFSFISINFNVQNNVLIFYCKNSKQAVAKANTTGGIGLQNIKRRLELMYGNTFKLDIEDEIKDFCVMLELPI